MRRLDHLPLLTSALLRVAFFVACELLVAGGVAKVWRPGPATRALRAARLPAARPAVRVLGLLEAGAGAWGMVAPAPAPAAVAGGLYVAFTAYLARAARAGSGSCGCAGERDLPPGRLHMGLNLVAAGAAGWAAAVGPKGIGVDLGAGFLHAFTFGVGILAAAYLAYVAVAYVPAAIASYQGHADHRAGHPGRPGSSNGPFAASRTLSLSAARLEERRS